MVSEEDLEGIKLNEPGSGEINEAATKRTKPYCDVLEALRKEPRTARSSHQTEPQVKHPL